MRTSTTETRTFPTTWAELIQVHVPSPVLDDVGNENTLEIIDGLMNIADPTDDQTAYTDTLITLVEKYEAEHYPIPDVPGIEVLKLLMESHDLNATQLSAILGLDASMGSKFLKGTRDLTKGHIMLLGKHFNVPPAVFLD